MQKPNQTKGSFKYTITLLDGQTKKGKLMQSAIFSDSMQEIEKIIMESKK